MDRERRYKDRAVTGCAKSWSVTDKTDITDPMNIKR